MFFQSYMKVKQIPATKYPLYNEVMEEPGQHCQDPGLSLSSRASGSHPLFTSAVIFKGGVRVLPTWQDCCDDRKNKRTSSTKC